MPSGLPTSAAGAGAAPAFYTVAEVAAILRVSKMTVYRMVHSGELVAMQVGRSFRVPQRAIEEYLSAGLGDWGHEDQAVAGS
ncbi:helix-turn-helix domain-containing protein [Actinomyces bovis]|nr:helix-turn-helix domain-containing protein [Actinomyces bovis]